MGYWSKLPNGMKAPYVYVFCFLGMIRTIYLPVHLSPWVFGISPENQSKAAHPIWD